MVCNNNRYHSENTILGISHVVNSKDDVEFAMLFTALGFAFSFRLRSSSYDGTRRPNRSGKPKDSDPALFPPRRDGSQVQLDFG